MKYKLTYVLAGLLGTVTVAAHGAQGCNGSGVAVQVLGSGGPEATDQRASSGYLVWHEGKARILVDLGPGSMLRYEQSDARLEDLDMILLTHLHVDHSGDLPALLKAAFFTDRDRELPLYGPTGNTLMPPTTGYVQSLFAKRSGAFRYLADYVTGEAPFRLRAHNVPITGTTPRPVTKSSRFAVSAAPVPHGALPALAWRVEIAGRTLAFSGDTSGDSPALAIVAKDADVFVAHHAIPQDATGVARKLHMPPSVIGEIAARAKVKQLVLSHRMTRSLGRETESEREIRKHYDGPTAFADDGQCFEIER